jgi:hypothetical protein
VHSGAGTRLALGQTTQAEGRLVKKDLSLNWARARRRTWRTYHAVLQHPHLFLFKDHGGSGGVGGGGSSGHGTVRSMLGLAASAAGTDTAAKAVLTLTAEGFADVARDYKKRRHVLRLMPGPGTEVLLAARSDEDMDAWLTALTRSIDAVRARPCIPTHNVHTHTHIYIYTHSAVAHGRPPRG